jgi:adenosylcobinamide-phosphate synthase
MDSMVGYHNERYEYFGRAAARLDDVVNFLPARISALLMVLAAFLLGGASGAVNGQRREYSASDALRIFLRDRYNHKSPNSAQTESACAGALQVRLAGDAYYFGELVRKPYIGDDIRPIETEDIKRACRLMMTTAYLCAAICFAAGCFVL